MKTTTQSVAIATTGRGLTLGELADFVEEARLSGIPDDSTVTVRDATMYGRGAALTVSHDFPL